MKEYTPSSFEREWAEAIEAGIENACRFMLANSGRVKTWLSALKVSSPAMHNVDLPRPTIASAVHVSEHTLRQGHVSPNFQAGFAQCKEASAGDRCRNIQHPFQLYSERPQPERLAAAIRCLLKVHSGEHMPR